MCRGLPQLATATIIILTALQGAKYQVLQIWDPYATGLAFIHINSFVHSCIAKVSGGIHAAEVRLGFGWHQSLVAVSQIVIAYSSWLATDRHRLLWLRGVNRSWLFMTTPWQSVDRWIIQVYILYYVVAVCVPLTSMARLLQKLNTHYATQHRHTYITFVRAVLFYSNIHSFAT